MSGLLARLIAAGTPPDLIEEVAMLCARAQVDRDAIEARLNADAERTGRYRDRRGLSENGRASLCGAVIERDGFVCTYCDKDLTNARYAVDHVVPLGRGGTNDLDNLTMACIGCNSSKRDRLLHTEWTPPKNRGAK